MKVLSLLQPWASLVVIGAKRIETRSWNTKYRGPLLIHASLGKSGRSIAKEYPFKDFMPKGDYVPPTSVFSTPYYKVNFDALPFGAIIGQVELIHTEVSEQLIGRDVYHYGSSHKWTMTEQEKAFGDYSPGRYGWLLSNPIQFPVIIPAKGSLSLWEFDMPENIGYNIPGGGHASFAGMPDAKTVEAVEEMVEHAKQMNLPH